MAKDDHKVMLNPLLLKYNYKTSEVATSDTHSNNIRHWVSSIISLVHYRRKTYMMSVLIYFLSPVLPKLPVILLNLRN